MSYRLKLTVTIALLIALSFGIGGTVIISASFSASRDQEIQGALESFQTVQATLQLLNSFGGHTSYPGLADAMYRMESLGMDNWQALRLSAGTTVIASYGQASLLEGSLEAPGESQCSYRTVSDGQGQGVLILSRIDAWPETLELKARYDLSAVYRTRQTQQRLYIIIYIAVVAIGLLGAFSISASMTKSLRTLTRTARQITGGDLSKRTHLGTPDEFGQLSRDFDAMADKLQENIARLETQMQRQESFMGAFAHELKTPMTSILGFAELLRQGDLDESTRMRAADYIYTEGQRLERLSFKLLELLLLKNDKLSLRQVQLSQFLWELEQAMAPGLRKKGIRLVCKGEPGRAVFEPDLVKSLLYNLIDNAAKAMDTGGLIAVTAAPIPGGCQLQVADNGRGMEKQELSRITEAFYRVDKARSRSQGGAGLGLALCKQIVELHKGDIRFASIPGAGTRVTVTLYGKAGKRHADS